MCGHRVVLVVLLWITGTLNGSWGNEELLFTTIDSCGEAPLMDNGDIVERSRVHLKYHCRPGYTLYGEDTVLCFSNRSWSELPRCKAKTACFDPKIPNANYTAFQSVEHNERVWIRCNTGYEDKRKRAIARCQNGVWTVLPVCEKRDDWCEPPPQIPNAVIINQVYKDMFLEDEVVEYVCQSGFELETYNNQTTCSYGNWTSLPSCREKQTGQDGGQMTTASPISSGSDNNNQPSVDSCTTPPRPVRDGEVYHSPGSMSARYECKDLYKLTGNPKVRCQNGQWPRPPTCEVNFCTLDPSRHRRLENGDYVYIKSGTNVELKCADSSWKTARAKCEDNRLSLSECCRGPTHFFNNCDYFPVRQ